MVRWLAILLLSATSMSTMRAQANKSYEELKKHGDSLLLLSGDYLNYDLDSAEILARQLLEFSLDNEFLRGEGQAYGQLGHINSYRAKRGTALLNYQKALAIYEQLEKPLFVAMLHENIGFLLYEDDKHSEALEYLNRSLTYFQENDFSRRIANNQLAIALIYMKQDKSFEEIMSLLNTVEHTARQDSLMYLLVETLNSKSFVHLEKNIDIKSAIDFSVEARRVIAFWDPEDYFDLSISYSNLSKAYYLVNNYTTALSYNDSAIHLLKKIDGVSELASAYNIRMKILSSQQNYQEALAASAELLELNKVMSDQQQSNQLNDLQTQYETKQKEAAIASLTQQTAIQELKIKQRNQTILISFVVFLLLLVFAYFLYHQKNNSRKRKQAELQQRFLRSQLNPHFISNALVAIQSSLVQNDTEATSAYLSIFSRLMREILENSRQEYIPLEDEVIMLKDYLELNKRRLNDSFTYEIKVDENLNSEMDTIPPMFVQPFVENALEHGLGTGHSDGKIELQFLKERDFLKVIVTDNGNGFSGSSSKQSGKKSLSSDIIKERMTLLNRSLKNKIQLSISERKDVKGNVCGTLVELLIPLKT